MKDWPALPADDELERADALLGQADALLRRHRGGDFRAPAPTPAESHATPEALALEDDDDLPILTDIVDDFELADLGLPALPDASPPPATEAPPPDLPASPVPPPTVTEQSAAIPQPPPAPSAPITPAAATATAAPADDQALLVSARAALIEELVELDTEIARSVEDWLADELPQIVARELDSLAARIHTDALAQLRATLLPALSERIARRIDKLVD